MMHGIERKVGWKRVGVGVCTPLCLQRPRRLGKLKKH